MTRRPDSPFVSRIRAEIEAIGQERERLLERSLGGLDVGALDAVIERAEKVGAALLTFPPSLRDAELGELLRQAGSTIRDLRGARERLATFKQRSTSEIIFDCLVVSAQRTYERYEREIAGGPLAFRDIELLSEMRNDLQYYIKRMQALPGTPVGEGPVRTAEEWVARLTDKIAEVDAARLEAKDDVVSTLVAHVVEAQRRLHARHFEGKEPTSRRPALLARMIENLRRARELLQTRGLAAPAAAHDQAHETLDEILDAYERELAAIKEARKTTSIERLLRTFARESDALFDEYRRCFAGRPRSDVSADQLERILDELGEILRQMLAFDLVHELPEQQEARRVTWNRVGLLSAELRAVLEVQAHPPEA